MNHETAVANAKDVADRVLAPAARQNDREARFSSEAIKAFGPAGLLGLMLPADIRGSALGPRTFAPIVSEFAEADPSVAMVYLMHVCAAATIAAARNGATVAPTLKEIAAGRLPPWFSSSEALAASAELAVADFSSSTVAISFCSIKCSRRSSPTHCRR